MNSITPTSIRPIPQPALLPTQGEFIGLLTVVNPVRFFLWFFQNHEEHLDNELSDFFLQHSMRSADLAQFIVTPPEPNTTGVSEYLQINLVLIHLMQNNLATADDIFNFFQQHGTLQPFLTFLEDIHSSLPPNNPPAPATTNQPREVPAQGLAQTQERFIQLLRTINPRQLHDFFTRYDGLTSALENLYLGYWSTNVLNECLVRDTDGTSYLAHAVFIGHLLNDNRITYGQILTVLNQYGLAPAALMSFLNNPNPPQQLTQAGFIELLTTVNPLRLLQFLRGHENFHSELHVFFRQHQMSSADLARFIAYTQEPNTTEPSHYYQINLALIHLMQNNLATMDDILALLRQQGILVLEEFMTFLEDPSSSLPPTEPINNPPIPFTTNPIRANAPQPIEVSAEADQDLIRLLRNVNEMQMHEWIGRPAGLHRDLLHFYNESDLALTQFIRRLPNSFAYLPHNSVMVHLIERNAAQLPAILAILATHGLTRTDFVNFLQNPLLPTNPPPVANTQQSTSQPLTREAFLLLLDNNEPPLHLLFEQYMGLSSAIRTFYDGRSVDNRNYPLIRRPSGLTYLNHNQIITGLLQNNQATLGEILTIFRRHGLSQQSLVNFLNNTNPPHQPLTQEAFLLLLGNNDVVPLNPLFRLYDGLPSHLFEFYNRLSPEGFNHLSVRSQGAANLNHNQIITNLLQNNLTTLSEILSQLAQRGLSAAALESYLLNPGLPLPQTPTARVFITLLRRTTGRQLFDFCLQHNGLSQALNNFYHSHNMLAQEISRFMTNVRTDSAYSSYMDHKEALIALLAANRATPAEVLNLLSDHGITQEAFNNFITIPTTTQSTTPTIPRVNTQSTSNFPRRTRTQPPSTNPSPTANTQRPRLTLTRCLELLRNVSVENIAQFLRQYRIASPYVTFMDSQMQSRLQGPDENHPRPDGPHDFGFHFYLNHLGGTLPVLLAFLRTNGVSEAAFVNFLESCIPQPSPPIPRTPPQTQPTTPTPKSLVRRSIESISSKELNSLFSADIKKASAASLWKHRLWKTAAITSLVAYSALTFAALLITGFFAPFFVLPIVALASIGLLFPTLKLYNTLQPKITASKKIADEEHNIVQELTKLNKLSDAEFTKKYSHLFNLEKIQHPEIETLVAEKGVNLYRPIIARLNYYNNKWEQLQKTEEQLEKTYAMKKNKEDLAAGRNFLNEKYKLQLEIADAKVHAAFIQALLQEPSTLKNKKLTFATLQDPKIKNLGLSQILNSNLGQLADHILGY